MTQGEFKGQNGYDTWSNINKSFGRIYNIGWA